MSTSPRKIAVIGLGYVGLPVAVAFAEHFEHVVGFDISARRVQQLQTGHDITGEVPQPRLQACGLKITDVPDDLRGCDFFVVTVPTPIDDTHRPDLSAIEAASKLVGSVLSKGAIVVYESTVYPGLTEQHCGPLLEQVSGLRCGTDFTLGYSPERINPGDTEHTFERIIKVVSGQDAATLEIVAGVYGAVVKAGIHQAPSIMVAEAAKVIENTQRDLNIALMNELAIIFDRLGIDTLDVLAAAGTKWNFLKFFPGLVGGHCIGVDPYYLTTRAEQVGIDPQVILAGRRINDGMGKFVAEKMVKQLLATGRELQKCRIGVVGITFKEDVPDIRNSRVPDIVTELRAYSANVQVADPLADPGETAHEYGIDLVDIDALADCDGLILAVPHRQVLDPFVQLASGGSTAVVCDVKGRLDRAGFPTNVTYWRL